MSKRMFQHGSGSRMEKDEKNDDDDND